MKNTLKIALAAVTLIGGTSLATGYVSAQEGNRPVEDFAQRLSQRFGLNQSDVESFMQEMHDERQADREAQYITKLDELVSAGTLTSAQKDSLLALHEQNQEAMESMRDQDLTPEERREQMDAHREAMDTWAEENGIDIHELMMGFGNEGGMKGRGGMGRLHQ